MFNDLYKKPLLTILSEAKTDNGIMRILVPFMQSDEKNGNGRIYPRALMKREVNRVSKDISDGRMLGSADHPKGGNTELNSVSHIVTKMKLDDAGKGWAELKIMDTTAGKNLKTIIKSGGKLGVSTRGFGTQNPDTKKVNDDYKLTGLDIVANPSYKAGTFSSDSIFESFDLTGKKPAKSGSSGAYSKEGAIMKNKLIEELREDTEFSRVVKMLYENEKDCTLTLLEYATKNAMQIRAVLGVENKTYPDYETAFMKLKSGEQNIADGKKMDRTPDKPAEPKDFYEQSKITGTHPEKMAEIVNKNRAKPAITERRIAIRKQLVLSGGPSRTTEQVDALVEKILAGEAEICESVKLKTEKEQLEEAERKKPNKRLAVKQELKKWGVLAGFTQEQIQTAIDRKMEMMDEEEAK